METNLKGRYPGLVYNFFTLAGLGLALFGLAAIIILFLLNVFAKGSNPYLGIFTFIIFPGIMVLGILLVPFGMWREKKRREAGKTRPLIIDLGNAHHRNLMVTSLAGASTFLLITTIGLYQGYQYTESVSFCGKVCHQVMNPEYTAYMNSSHAQVECAACHIGPGAGWYVKSKLSGVRQVFKTVLGTYPTPIPTPVENLRPAQEVCEECHWPQKFFPATQVTRDHFLSDRENTHWRINLLVRVGGTSASPAGRPTGIHWHIDEANHMTYVATDGSRQAFDQVTWSRDGRDVVYTRDGAPLADSVLVHKRAEKLVRPFDCMDCHNRPSHRYRSPMESVNEAMASGRLDPGIPWIKRVAVETLSREYSTAAGAGDSIALAMGNFYEEQGVSLPLEAIAAVQDIYGKNIFPEMRVRWDRYPENQGHFIYPGCFRCHGSDLRNADGEGISDDCNLCHTIASQGIVHEIGDTLVAAGLPFRHPADIGGAETEMPCTDCHTGDDSVFPAMQ